MTDPAAAPALRSFSEAGAAWWHTLAPEARQAWIIHITGWTMGKVIDAAYAHAINADPPLSTDIPPELGITG